MLPRALPLALLMMAAPFAAQAQEVLFGHQPDPKSKTRVECVALFTRPAPSGYLPVRVTVNNANEQDGSIDIRCTSSDGNYAGNGSELTSSFKLPAPAGKATIHNILVPCTTLMNYAYGASGSASVSLTMSGSFGSANGNLAGQYGSEQQAILMSEALFTPNAGSLDSELNTRSAGRHYGGSLNFAARFNPAEMPDDWRAYSGYDGVVMTDADWTAMSPGARTAILRWNRLGGRLVILAVSTNSDMATLGISTASSGLRNAARSLGSVLIEQLPAGNLTLDPSGVKRLIGNFSSSTSKDVLPPLNQSLTQDFGRSWPLHGIFDAKSYNYGVFIVILIAFGILVGPVNLFVFAKSGQRHRLFITTPLIALGTSVLLVGLIIIIDGFGGRGIRVALMEVRPEDGENSAYVYQEQVSRTGVLLGGGFTVDEPAAITPVPLDADSQWSRLTDQNNGGGMRYEANLRDNKLEVEGDWFQSRSEQGQALRAVIPTRGRIELRGNGGSGGSSATPPSLVSTFEFPIEKLYYTDPAGTYWCAEGIEPGKSFVCRQATLPELQLFVKEAGTQFTARTKKALLTLSPEVSQTTRGGRHFIALTRQAPGVPTFKGIDWQKTTTYVTGPVLAP